MDDGQIEVAAGTELDYETKTTYMVTLTAEDSFGASDTIMVTIMVTDMDEVPEIMLGGLAISGPGSPSYVENRTDLVATYTVSGPEAASATWSLSGDDANAFSLSNDGMLMFRQSPNFEAPTDMDRDNIYMVTVMADDDTNLADKDVTVTVTNVAELGMVSGNATADYAENGMDAVATYTADGPDAGMAAWMLMGDDADAFSINNGGELTFAPMPNYEMPTDMGMDNVYQVTVQATAGGEMGMVDVTVTVTNVDEMGRVTFWRDGQDATNDPIMVGDMLTGLVEDPDGFMDADVSWQWASSATADGTFAPITGATDAAYTPVEADGGMYLQAMASYTDGHGLGKTAMAVSANMVSMAITNTAPAFPAATAERMVAENTEAGEDVGGPVAATDDDTGDTLTYTLGGTDMASFDIDDATGQITVGMGTMLDYEATQNTYMVTVTVADAAGEMDMVDVTVTVTNVDEMGRVTFWRDGQDATNGPIMVGDMLTGLVEDPDGFMDADVSWQWASSATADGTFAPITGATDAAYTPVEADGGMYLQAMASYTDGHGLGKTAMAVSANMVSMAITNTAPAFPAATAERMVAENTEAGEDVGGPVAATDDDTGDTLTYTLGGTDMASFDIDDATGQITVGMGTMLDYEATQNTYMVTVTVADAAGEMDMVDVTVTVTNVDEGMPMDLLTRYDDNNNNVIDLEEVFRGIDDYFDYDDRLTLDEVYELVDLYFES